MMNSPLPDMITRTKPACNETCVQCVDLLWDQTEPHKLPGLRGVLELVGNQESRA